MANPRSIKIHEEAVGEPRGNEQDTVVVDVSYTKGRGYHLGARVERITKEDGYSTRAFMLFTGIAHHELLFDAKRFSAKKLDTIGQDALARAKEVGETLKAELARRIAAGEDY